MYSLIMTGANHIFINHYKAIDLPQVPSMMMLKIMLLLTLPHFQRGQYCRVCSTIYCCTSSAAIHPNALTMSLIVGMHGPPI